MLATSQAVSKLLKTPHKKIWIKENDDVLHIIPDGVFTSDEIEELREYDSTVRDFYGYHLYANFLPDDIRPPGVKKL